MGMDMRTTRDDAPPTAVGFTHPLRGVPARFKVVRTDRELDLGGVDDALRAAGGEVVLLADGADEDQVRREVADADLLLMCYARITRRVIEGATRLRAIVKYGVGIDAIDIDAARERGIPVVNVPAYAEETVAEGAFALLMGLFKRFKPILGAMERTGWIWPERPWLAHDLAGKTLGLVGLGRIGRSMARMAGAFRMRVLAVDPHLPASQWPEGVLRCGSLEEMLPACDAVSIHCVLNAETRHLVGAAELARMRPSAVLVNVSRGEIVDEAALWRPCAPVASPARRSTSMDASHCPTSAIRCRSCSRWTRSCCGRTSPSTRTRPCNAWRPTPWIDAARPCGASRLPFAPPIPGCAPSHGAFDSRGPQSVRDAPRKGCAATGVAGRPCPRRGGPDRTPFRPD